MTTSHTRQPSPDAAAAAVTAVRPTTATSTVAKARVRNAIGLTNMQTRALTIVTLVPLMFVLGLQSKMHVAAMVWVGMLGASVEWSGVKRHLKVELLLCDRAAFASSARATSESSVTGAAAAEAATAPDAAVVHPHEYARPVTPLTLYTIVKHVAWACLAFAAYHGEAAFVAGVALYFLVFVTLSLTVHNRLEERIQQAVAMLQQLLGAQRPTRTRDATARAAAAATSNKSNKSNDNNNTTTSVTATSLHKKDDDVVDVPAADAPSRCSLWQHFRAMELFLVAQRQPTEQFLDFSLDIFGLVWLCGLVHPVLLYSVPGVGVPWVYSATISNFVNDICALLVGRAMRAQRACVQDAASSPSSTAAALWRWCVRHGQQPLYTAISPNKSVGGALAGVAGCAVTFVACMCVAYHWLPSPAADVIAPQYQSVLLWLLVGAAMGVMGVIGDLAQSLLKRSAHVKDAGFIIPGHGGMLDRVDGLLLVYPFMYCTVALLRALSAA